MHKYTYKYNHKYKYKLCGPTPRRPEVRRGADRDALRRSEGTRNNDDTTIDE